jgi:hypothetical protein
MNTLLTFDTLLANTPGSLNCLVYVQMYMFGTNKFTPGNHIQIGIHVTPPIFCKILNLYLVCILCLGEIV